MLEEDIGRAIETARKRIGVSLEKLAESTALDAALLGSIERGERLVSTAKLDRLASALGLDAFALYGGRDQFLPADFPQPENKIMNMKQEALGILETQGLTAILEATDAMLKSANVTLVGKEKIGAAYVTVIVRGDVAAVTAAVDAGSKAVGQLGKLIAAHVIARPHDDLTALLPK